MRANLARDPLLSLQLPQVWDTEQIEFLSAISASPQSDIFAQESGISLGGRGRRLGFGRRGRVAGLRGLGGTGLVGRVQDLRVHHHRVDRHGRARLRRCGRKMQHGGQYEGSRNQPMQQQRQEQGPGIFAQHSRHLPRTCGRRSATGRGCARRLGEKAEFRGAGALHERHRTHHDAVRHGGIRADQHRRLRVAPQDRRRTRIDGRLGGRLIGIAADVDVQAAAGIDGEDQRLMLGQQGRIDGLPPASGSSTLTPSFSSGAVIMNMTRSTNITSMYGTTLISPMSLRRRGLPAMRLPRRPARRPVALQNGGELLHEGVEAQFQAAHLVGEPVVGHHGRDGRKQPHRRRDERFGDAGRDGRESGLLDIAQIVEGTHDAPHGAEQTHIGVDRPGGGEHGEVLLQPVDFAHLRDAHRAPRAFEEQFHGGSLLSQAAELPESRLEDALHTGAGAPLGFYAAIQGAEIAARPEGRLELICLAARLRNDPALAEYHRPG